MDEPAGFNLEQALLGEQHNKTVQSWIEKYEIKRFVDGGSGKVYVRDQNGYFKVDTESDLSAVLKEFL